MSIFYSSNEKMIVIQGQTYAFRHEIKALGGQYCGVRKVWQFPHSALCLADVEALCLKSGGGILGGDSSPASNAQKVVVGEQSRYREQIELARSSSVERDNHLEPHQSQGYTISQLMNRAASLISNGFADAVWVVGEVQSFQDRANAAFFDFAEAEEKGSKQGSMTVRATLWSSSKQAIISSHRIKKITELVQDGLKIRCLCRVTLYQGRGQLSLNVINIDPDFTKGALALARENLLKELRAKGLDKRNKQLSLSPLPFLVGLISAEGSRAKNDFIHQLYEGGFAGDLIFVSCRMQGEGVCSDVVAAMKILSARGCDLIVVTRGGGSAADLRWFDMPELAYAITLSTTPIVAAVGHHDDYCVAEEVCYLRQKTPTAAADYINSLFTKVKSFLDKSTFVFHSQVEKYLLKIQDLQNHYRMIFRASIEKKLLVYDQNIARICMRLNQASSNHLRFTEVLLAEVADELKNTSFKRVQVYVHHLEHKLPQLMASKVKDYLHARQLETQRVSSALQAGDPSKWLANGWTRLEHGGKPIKSSVHLHEGTILNARLLDGLLDLEVRGIVAKSFRLTNPTSENNKGT